MEPTLPMPDFSNTSSVVGYLITVAITTAIGLVVRAIERKRINRMHRNEINLIKYDSIPGPHN